MSKKDKVIIIILNFNGLSYWPDLMPFLSQEKYSDFELEIVVIDNHSTDDSVNYLKENYPAVTIIQNAENLGFAGGNNVGYQYARRQGADFIYLLNQDTVITSGFLQPLYDFAKHNKFGSLQSKIKFWSDQHKINSLGNAIHYLGFGYSTGLGREDWENKIKKINYASGAGVFLSVKVLEELNKDELFDQTMFMYLEDLDLGWSLQLLGYDNFLIPDSVIYHKYEFNRSMKQSYWFERNRWWVMLKNYKVATLCLILPAWLLMEVGQLLYALFDGRFKQKLRACFWVLSPRQWHFLLARRRYIQTKRKRTDRQVVLNFQGSILFQPLDSLMLKLANIIFGLYWLIIKNFIFW
ncbi:MAG: hypothetical protein COV55_04115 [Candidatus Komeilibacteria bacterium CG11_big_fil_rev_8_21_14_0_20_36_20]|uniref:Glycosyltransferase 2-like domain-containing protein n=1 Tax=Candidatus Komeilibacteria bacterium CG11_big_fil_rev_8_21_14_0_20_36_20 TaxID=1974477 RepID=A0A2H0NC28_9BACT|nr:MAG: hypothetical protein COV55_04115 [Candidatus Komeilibacteria bacterium CG11_big_fil_rev_8_21_14_0_20_36_20]PIR82017.1 MAG: hypothetical protein COU21_00750 [Candidatus Komeilibacteria bacterium CG10_big_fil_rev_8_21_14_0_10_36_65]PJC55555.1 MAG: hypothetical protein CO027_01755 [Candidatus Komeilibacteria bacterium CG_4_9_14_0_2_um_filter_36_13]